MGCAIGKPDAPNSPAAGKEFNKHDVTVERYDIAITMASDATTIAQPASSSSNDGTNSSSSSNDGTNSSSSSSSSDDNPPRKKAARFAPIDGPVPTLTKKTGDTGSEDVACKFHRKAAARVKMWKGQKDAAEMLATLDSFTDEFPGFTVAGDMRERLIETLRKRPDALQKAYRSCCAILTNQSTASPETQALALALLQYVSIAYQGAQQEVRERQQQLNEADNADDACTIS